MKMHKGKHEGISVAIIIIACILASGFCLAVTPFILQRMMMP